MSTIGYYIITHKPTGMFYVGSSYDLDRRIRRHQAELSSGQHINKNLQSTHTQWDDWTVEKFPTRTLDEARIGEQKLLDQHVGSRLCCNVSVSSTNGLAGVKGVVPVETRIKNLEKATEARRGSSLSDEHRANISRSSKGRVPSKQCIEAVRKANTGRNMSEEHRQIIVASNTGKVRSEEHKKIISELKSKKVSIDGVVYGSLKSAAEAIGLSDVTVRKRLKDDINYPTWVYLA